MLASGILRQCITYGGIMETHIRSDRRLSRWVSLSRLAGMLALAGVLAACAGCGAGDGGRSTGNGTLRVVAGESFWGSIAAQLGGTHVQVTSIVTDPNADPHDYESTTADARTFAQ